MKTSSKVGATGAAVIACCVAFTPGWEGTDLVAKTDKIGTGHPLTYCHGQTDEFGKVKAGQRFTPAQCDKLLAESLPKYLAQLKPCIKVDLPTKTEGALLDAAYNAGSSAVCKSPMVAKMNGGSLIDGCNAFKGWYVRASGRVVKGLINRRNGEAKLCLEGASEPVNLPTVQKPSLWRKIIDFITSLFKRS